MLVLEACSGSSASYGVVNAANTGGVMVSNRSIGAAFVAMSTGSVNTSVVGNASFLACTSSGLFVLLYW